MNISKLVAKRKRASLPIRKLPDVQNLTESMGLCAFTARNPESLESNKASLQRSGAFVDLLMGMLHVARLF